ncbi:hypothetical protein Tco_0901759, partial [Tanacetum coccineum]
IYSASFSCKFSDMGDDVDISTLTIEQYLALIQDNNRPAIVKSKIGDDVEFEINSNFMRELRRKLFTGAGLEVEKRLPVGMINTWDLLEKEFIWQYCSPFKAAKNLKEIHNFKQEICETLYQAWERYNDLLFKCPQHDLNNHQKEKINDNPDNIDDIQESFKEAHPTKESLLKKEDEAVEQREKRTTIGKGNMKEPIPRDLPPTPFLGHLNEQIVHITPPDDDYIAPTTSPTLDKQLNEFKKECSDNTRVADKANGNLVKDVQEFSDIKIYDCETII